MAQQQGEQVGINIDPFAIIGEKQVRLEAAIRYAAQLETQLTEAKGTIDRLAGELEEKKGDIHDLLAVIDDLKKEQQ